MRIALVNQFFPPDLAPTGHLAASLAQHRVAEGDVVSVICGRGPYVRGSPVARGSSDANPRDFRLWTPGLGKDSVLRRVLDYAWFYLTAAVRLLLLPRQDVIIALTTPPFIAWAGVLHRVLHRSSRLILWCMDCYPEALTRAGLIGEHGVIARFLRWQNRMLFRQIDHAVCLDEAMRRLLFGQYVRPGGAPSTSVIPNWEPVGRFRASPSPMKWELADQLGLGSRLLVLHIGNAGYGHDFATVAEAAEALRDEPVSFLFVGGGERWKSLQQAKRERALSHWHLRSYLPAAELNEAMAAADCALITLRDAFLGVISPSKLHAALAMGLPILYIGPEGGNVDQAIRRFDCGVSLRHGDAQGVADFLRRLQQDDSYAAGLRRRAHMAFEAAYSDRTTLPAFDRVIQGQPG